MIKKITEGLYEASLEYYTNWRAHLKELAIALFIVLCIRSMLGVVYRIPTGSMIPTLIEGDILVANRFYYGLKIPFTEGLPGFKLPAIREVETGDLIIFRAPEEVIFYDLRIFYSEENSTEGIAGETLRPSSEETAFLNRLNGAAAQQRVISLREDEIDLDWLSSAENYIFLEAGPTSVTLHLHRDIYHQYKEELSTALNVVASYKRRSILTFADEGTDSFVERLSRPLVSTGSLLSTVLLNSPFFLTYALPYKWIGSRMTELPPGLRNENSQSINFYPSSSLSVYREYVKRVVALAGDQVEIRNKRLFVNGELLPWKDQTSDPNHPDYAFFTEEMAYSEKSEREKETFTHPVRISSLTLEPFTPFNDTLWPLNTESPYAIGFRDNFGPVTVPEDSYFVMGDNRDESLDSRYIGFVPKWEVKGTPMYIFFPTDRRGRIR